MKQPSKSCCRRTGYKLECGEEEWRGGEETEGFCMVAKLADVELWGVEGWAGKDSETALCSWESPMEKFLWHFVLRGGQFQRGWNHSAGIWVRRVMLQSIPQVWAGLKPGSNLCSPIPIFHTAQTPWEWMDWHKAPLLKCRCLKAPKISLTSSGLLEPIKTVPWFDAPRFGWCTDINAFIGQLQFALYSLKPRDGCCDPLRRTGAVKFPWRGLVIASCNSPLLLLWMLPRSRLYPAVNQGRL